jgi:hypothetical protein
MPWTLECIEGPSSSRKSELKPGVSVSVGQASGVTQVFPEDQMMSPLHFTVAVMGGTVRLQNMSRIGTELNGHRTEVAVLQAGDRIKAGQTVFVVHAPALSPYPAQLRIGGWGFEIIPEGWQQDEGFGFHLSGSDVFKSNITAVEEPLMSAGTLASYVQTQVELARAQIAGMSFENPVPLKVPGSGEALMLAITIPQASGLRVIQRQVYALSSGIVGIFTATVLESEPHRGTIDAVIAGLSYFQG